MEACIETSEIDDLSSWGGFAENVEICSQPSSIPRSSGSNPKPLNPK